MNINILVLKLWQPLFYSQYEFSSSTPVLVKLPRLPIEFWSNQGLKAIRDYLGKFLVVDDTYYNNDSCSMAHILFEIDLRQGLYELMKHIGNLVFALWVREWMMSILL